MHSVGPVNVCIYSPDSYLCNVVKYHRNQIKSNYFKSNQINSNIYNEIMSTVSFRYMLTVRACQVFIAVPQLSFSGYFRALRKSPSKFIIWMTTIYGNYSRRRIIRGGGGVLGGLNPPPPPLRMFDLSHIDSFPQCDNRKTANPLCKVVYYEPHNWVVWFI